MPRLRHSDIIEIINRFAPLSYQESWDNSGVQVGDVNDECTGVLLCVDPTEGRVAEAIAHGCNLIVSHHPLLFRGLKQIVGETQVQRTVIAAIRGGVTIYSAHTSLDSTVGGISARMALMLGVVVDKVLSPTVDENVGLGVVGHFEQAVTAAELVDKVKRAFGSPVCRCTGAACDKGGAESAYITKVAMCGGAGGEFIPLAVAAGAQAYITSDTRYHDFVDYQKDIFLIDIGHFESERCAKDIFYEVISEKIPNFAVRKSNEENNPINYL